MLKRLKSAVQNQHEKSASNGSDGVADGTETRQFHEGIMCPECRATFETVDNLQKHYEQSHGTLTSVKNDGDPSDGIEASLFSEDSTANHDRHASGDIVEKRPVESNASDLSSFVCPQCFQELPSADDLKSHFMAMHSNDADTGDFDSLAMRQEINDLRATLKEEKRYAAELKKEVEKMHQLIETNSISPASLKPGTENESMYYLQQIQMLEAGKTLVTTKMLELERQVAELTRANEGVLREKERILDKSMATAREHASIKSLYDEEQCLKAARESRIHELKDHVQDLEAELSQRPTDDDVKVLQKELVHAQTLMNDMAQDIERETGEWRAKCGDLEKTSAEREEKIADLIQKLDDMTEETEQLKGDSKKETEGSAYRLELESKIAQLESDIRTNEASLQQFHDTVVALRERLDEMTEVNEELETKLYASEERESTFQSEMESRTVEATDRLEQAEETIRHLTNDRDELLKSVESGKGAETALSQLTAGNALLASKLEKMANVEKRNSDLTMEKAELIRLRDETASLFAGERLNLENKLSRCTSMLEEEKTRSRAFENTINELKEELSLMKGSEERLFTEKKEADLKIEELRVKLEDKETAFKAKLMEYKEEIDMITGEKEAMVAAKEELASVLKATEAQAADLRAQLSKVEEILRVTREETTAILHEKQEELDKALEEVNKANLEKETIEETLSTEIKSLKQERSKLLDDIEELMKSSEDHDRTVAELLADKMQLEKAVLDKDQEMEMKEKKISALLMEREMKAEEMRTAKQGGEKVQEDLEKARSMLSEMVSKLEEEKTSNAQRIAEMEEEMAETRNATTRSRQEFSSREAEFNEQLHSLTDSLSDLRTQLATCNSKLEAETSRNSVLEKQCREMERRANEVNEEKRVLLEKCLMNERDMEEERDNCKELKRRLDDAVSALFELGRQHQSFQIDINRRYSRKWEDDAEVHNCTKCSKPFTVTIRKHHCRNCGLIFCAECSSKTAHVAVSKKPVRVCDSCYDELQSR